MPARRKPTMTPHTRCRRTRNTPAGTTAPPTQRKGSHDHRKAECAETAFAFAPFVPFITEAGAAAASGAGVALKAILGGTGLALLFGLSGDTPLHEIEETQEPAEPRAAGPDHNDRPSGLAFPPPPRRNQRRDDPNEEVLVYRVEGERWARVLIDSEGGVFIPLDSKRMLHLNFGDFARAKWWLQNKLDRGTSVNPTIKKFAVPERFLDEIRDAAISQDDVTARDSERQRPQIDDPRKAPDQFGLPESWLERLQEAIIQGTGETITPQSLGLKSRQRE